VVYQHIEADPVPPGQLRTEIPAEVEGLVLGMLAKDPTARPTAAQTAQYLSDVLDLDTAPPTDTPTAQLFRAAPPLAGPLPDATSPLPVPEPTREHRVSRRRPRRRRTAVVIGAAAAAVFAASTAAVGYHFIGDNTEPPASKVSPSTPRPSTSEPTAPAERKHPQRSTSPTPRPSKDAVREAERAPRQSNGPVKGAEKQSEAARKTAEEQQPTSAEPQTTSPAPQTTSPAPQTTPPESQKEAEREERKAAGKPKH
jgi:serine/threonine-protein kinase